MSKLEEAPSLICFLWNDQSEPLLVPTKILHDEMSSGVPYYEGELYNLIREGRGVPAVPLILVGIEP